MLHNIKITHATGEFTGMYNVYYSVIVTILYLCMHVYLIYTIYCA